MSHANRLYWTALAANYLSSVPSTHLVTKREVSEDSDDEIYDGSRADARRGDNVHPLLVICLDLVVAAKDILRTRKGKHEDGNRGKEGRVEDKEPYRGRTRWLTAGKVLVDDDDDLGERKKESKMCSVHGISVTEAMLVLRARHGTGL